MTESEHAGGAPPFLHGLPEPGEPLEHVEEWVTVLRAHAEAEIQLARGFLETQGFEVLVYGLHGATGFERLTDAAVSEAVPGPEHMEAWRGSIRLLVPPESAGEALEALRELRDAPGAPSEDPGDALPG